MVINVELAQVYKFLGTAFDNPTRLVSIFLVRKGHDRLLSLEFVHPFLLKPQLICLFSGYDNAHPFEIALKRDLISVLILVKDNLNLRCVDVIFHVLNYYVYESNFCFLTRKLLVFVRFFVEISAGTEQNTF